MCPKRAPSVSWQRSSSAEQPARSARAPTTRAPTTRAPSARAPTTRAPTTGACSQTFASRFRKRKRERKTISAVAGSRACTNALRPSCLYLAIVPTALAAARAEPIPRLVHQLWLGAAAARGLFDWCSRRRRGRLTGARGGAADATRTFRGEVAAAPRRRRDKSERRRPHEMRVVGLYTCLVGAAAPPRLPRGYSDERTRRRRG